MRGEAEKGDWRAEWWTGEASGDDQIRQMVGRRWRAGGGGGGGGGEWVTNLEMPSTGEEEVREGQGWPNVQRVFEAEQELEADPCEGISVSWGNSKGAQGNLVILTSTPSHKVPPKSLPTMGSPSSLT